MRKTRTATGPRNTAVRLLTVCAAMATVLAALTPSAAAAAAKTWTVRPGQSIQAVVNKAKSGDTVRLLAGTYHQAVCIDGKGLTIQGAGAGKTILDSPSTFTPTPCWSSPDQVSGLHFRYPDRAVTVTDLQTRNFTQNGIVAWGADGFTVKRTRGIGHGVYGILAASGSTNILFADNYEQGIERQGNSGTAGLSVSDTPSAKAVIKNNVSTGWHLGIFVRESRGGVVSGNTVRNNCIGVLVFDDSTTELPTADLSFIGGDWAVVKNKSIANNRFCLAGRDMSQHVSGAGIVVANADHVLIANNTIVGNRPSVPLNTLNFPSGGISILTVPSPPSSPGPNPGPAEYVRVTGNVLRDNVPTDILLYSKGAGNSFSGNSCTASSPRYICQ